MNDLEKKTRKKEYMKEYYEKNKEKILERQKEYNEKNKEKAKEAQRKYKQSEKGKKSNIIRTWKRIGLIGDYDAIYDIYIASTHCELCKQPYTESNKKCMDHCHISGEFRNICCHSCNLNMPKQTTDITYDRYINPDRNSWRFSKTFKGKRYFKSSKSRIDLLCYKYIAFLQIRVEWRKLTN